MGNLFPIVWNPFPIGEFDKSKKKLQMCGGLEYIGLFIQDFFSQFLVYLQRPQYRLH